MIDDLQCQIDGYSIDNMSFKVLCHTDNLALVSTKVSGLQRLIHCEDKLIMVSNLTLANLNYMISGKIHVCTCISSFVYW